MLTTDESLRQGSGTTLGHISSLYGYGNQTYTSDMATPVQYIGIGEP